MDFVSDRAYNLTMQEIADELGVSRQMATNICNSAFKSFRRELFKRLIEREDLL
jgi:transcriptional regulator with XRE-family HTH domain